MVSKLSSELKARLEHLHSKQGNIVILSGAGISAESGIPTFRGREGYWVAGSKEYHPQEMATLAMFRRDPETVWAWYLYRRGVCKAADPNEGHYAVVALENIFGGRFRLITQNVDGLHIRAGNSLERTYQIHGNIDFVRCANRCGQKPWQLPGELILPSGTTGALEGAVLSKLMCPTCGLLGRPHVLWFDEYYDEEHFRYEASIQAAHGADFLLVVGTSGATNLPVTVGQIAAKAGALIVDTNIETNPFSELASSQGGYFLKGPSASVLPMIVDVLNHTKEA